MKRMLIALSLLVLAAVAVPAIAHPGRHGKGKGPEVISLPVGFGPEGIATGRRHTFFVGSRDTGAIYKGSLRSGRGEILVPGGADRQATGLKVDRRGRLFVSGAGSKAIRVYGSRTGRLIRRYAVPEAGFINDVILTRRGAYFTDSQVPVIYFVPVGRQGALGGLRRIPITGDFAYGAGFNANGITAAKGGKTLILVKSSDPGKLYTSTLAGVTSEIDLGGRTVTNGDGILLKGRTLYVVQNQDNKVTVFRLSRDLSRGTFVREIESTRFAVPTTIARSHGRLYVVNAKFGSNTPDQTYEVVRVPKR